MIWPDLHPRMCHTCSLPGDAHQVHNTWECYGAGSNEREGQVNLSLLGPVLQSACHENATQPKILSVCGTVDIDCACDGNVNPVG